MNNWVNEWSHFTQVSFEKAFDMWKDFFSSFYTHDPKYKADFWSHWIEETKKNQERYFSFWQESWQRYFDLVKNWPATSYQPHTGKTKEKK